MDVHTFYQIAIGGGLLLSILSVGVAALIDHLS
jgi:hypothetical protein